MYLWLKAAHVASVLLFVGGTLALLLGGAALGTRAAGEAGPAGSLRAALRWWDARVTLPAMVAAWTFGLWIALSGGWFAGAWLPAKLALVVVISGLHGVLAGRLRRFDPEALPGSTRPPPVLAGAVILSILGIVALAVVKPG